MIVARILSLVIGYFCGMWVAGYFLGKKNNVDIRTKGSGNVGTTNTTRVLGKRMGALTLVLDCAKCILAVFLVWLIFKGRYPEHIRLLMLYGACGAVLGHDFPFYMKFKGGKGIAASLGLVLAVYPKAAPICILVFAIVVLSTQYVSLGSISAIIAALIQVYVFGHLGMLSFAPEDLLEAEIVTTMIGILAIVLHHSNIKRLIAGNENKMSFRSKRD